jgi:hypothetical protein
MNQNLKIILLVLAIAIFALLLVGAGIVLGRNFLARNYYGPGMMSGYGDGPAGGMPMYGQGQYGYGSGMMGGGIMGSGMMNGFNSQGVLNADPVSLDDAEFAVEEYLSLFDEDLEISEIMIFSNHAYVQVLESGTGIGAMELLVEPVTLGVYPEHGPNMMWNLKYGMMVGDNNFGMMGGGMMGGGMMGGLSNLDTDAEMLVTAGEAVDLAQVYLDQVYPGFEADEHADRFYGYYTLHIESDGEIVGMLSVNGFTRQVFVHTWHGEFIEMSEH